MKTGDKIARLRRENNYTQEQFAAVFGVSRQSISKWESGTAYPEVDKLIRMSELFGCTLDYLLKDDVDEPFAAAPPPAGNTAESPQDELFSFRGWRIRERTSDRMLFGLPLWQVARNAQAVFAVGMNARGLVALGLRARGLVSVGILSFGLFSVGLLSLGLVCIGLTAVGLLSLGCVAVGALAFGSVALGIVSGGAVACGDFAFGALAAGRYLAAGDRADAMIAIGRHEVNGSVFSRLGAMSAADRAAVGRLLDMVVPNRLDWAKALVKLLL